MCLSVWLSGCLCRSLCVSLSLSVSVSLFLSLAGSVALSLFVCLSLSVCLSVSLCHSFVLIYKGKHTFCYTIHSRRWAKYVTTCHSKSSVDLTMLTSNQTVLPLVYLSHSLFFSDCALGYKTSFRLPEKPAVLFDSVKYVCLPLCVFAALR